MYYQAANIMRVEVADTISKRPEDPFTIEPLEDKVTGGSPTAARIFNTMTGVCTSIEGKDK